MPKYEWYLVNKDDDLQARNLQNYFYNLHLRSFKPFNLFRVLNIFLKINVDLLSDVRNSVFLNPAIVLDGLHAMVT